MKLARFRGHGFERVLILPLLIGASAFPLTAQEPTVEIGPILQSNQPGPAPQLDERPRFAPDELLVRFQNGLEPTAQDVAATIGALGMELLDFNPYIGMHHYRLPVGISVAEGIRLLRDNPLVDYVEPNWIYYLEAVPNDTFYDNYSGTSTDLQKWYFDGIGSDRNVNAEAAWDITTGRSDVVIAIIDSGIDLDHPDLAGNIWTNPGEIPGNGVDDDSNGFIDDVNGWDFTSNNNDPNPHLGDGIDNDNFGGPDSNTFHGSFAASCAGSVGNNGVGVAGAAWDCQLMALQIFTDDGGAFTSHIANAITYAANNGADVSNMSFGGGFSSTVQSAINFSWGQGVVQVASAGNGNSSSQQYPSSLAHVISVGATDSGSVFAGGSGDIDGRASFSQYGPSAVDVVAPGSDLVGATVQNVASGSPGTPVYFFSSGTSFSSPLVAGLCALVISRARDVSASLSNDDIENLIQTNTVDLPDDPNDSPNGGSTWDADGRVDFEAAVNAVGGGGPTNNPPVADAGPDQSAQTNQNLTFDGSGSFDPDNDPLSYTWDFGDNSPTASGQVVNHSYSSAGTYVVTLTVDDGQLTDNDTAVVTVTDPPGGGTLIYMVSKGNNSIPGISGTVRNEDIFSYDPSTGVFNLVFDGSDVGIGSTAIDGFHLLSNGDFLVSLSAAFSVPGLVGGPSGTSTDDSDILQFTPTTLGTTTSGVWTFFFDGSDVGLTTNGEDVDAIGVENGDLILSTTGTANANGISTNRDEDMMRFFATAFGSTTSGSFVREFDGSDVGMGGNGSEDLDAVYFDNTTGLIYFSMLGNFSISGGLTGGDEDVVEFTPTSLGTTTSGSFSLFLDGSSLGFPSNVDIAGFHIDD